MDAWFMGTAVALGVVTILICTFFILYYCLPHYLIRIALSVRQMRANLKIKYIGDEDMIFCYGERGTPSPDKTSIIFVHGYTSTKDQWVPVIKNMPADLHLVALDLPGHGASSIPGEEVDLSLEYIMNTLNKFLDLMELSDRKVHLVGSSLGGAIVGVYTARHPERVAKVTLVCPAVQTPVESDFAQELKKVIDIGMENVSTEHCKLLPTDIDGLGKMFELCCYHRGIVKFSDQILKGILNIRAPKTDFHLRLFKAITSHENFGLLEKLAPKITPPSQLIWGKQDALIHVSGAEALRSKLPNCKRVDIIDRCGHAIDLDRPGSFTKYLLKFVINEFSQETNGSHME